MRYAIVSDVHGNIHAFRSVLQDAEQQGGFDVIWCLGDLLGYGAYPNECVTLLRQHPHVCIAGNHDLAAIALISLMDFSPDAAVAAYWTRRALRHDVWEFIAQLPRRHVEGAFTLVHGSPRDPIWEYLTSTSSAEASLAFFDTQYCLVGHSHHPTVFRCPSGLEHCTMEKPPARLVLDTPDVRLIFNPGSVGQPRDGDPRASYALLDTAEDTIGYRRVNYDIGAAQDGIYDAGLPEYLAERLGQGW